MSANLIFSLVLLSQALVLSWYLPSKVKARVSYVFKHYPASEYPLLYRSGQEASERSFARMMMFNNVMLVIGVAIIAWLNLHGEAIKGGLTLLIAFAYGMLQGVPLFIIDITTMRHYKQMRQEDNRPKRTAVLKPRSIFDYISGYALLGVLGVALIAILFDMYTKDFDLNRGVELFEAAFILIGTNLFFAWIVRWRVYGKKLNPYMDVKDHQKEVGIVVISSAFTSIAMSIFMIAMRAVNFYDLDDFEGVIMSIYMQLIIGFSMYYSINNIDVKEMNFDVYKAESQ